MITSPQRGKRIYDLGDAAMTAQKRIMESGSATNGGDTLSVEMQMAAIQAPYYPHHLTLGSPVIGR